jgi:hypothetical protein
MNTSETETVAVAVDAVEGMLAEASNADVEPAGPPMPAAVVSTDPSSAVRRAASSSLKKETATITAKPARATPPAISDPLTRDRLEKHCRWIRHWRAIA